MTVKSLWQWVLVCFLLASAWLYAETTATNPQQLAQARLAALPGDAAGGVMLPTIPAPVDAATLVADLKRSTLWGALSQTDPAKPEPPKPLWSVIGVYSVGQDKVVLVRVDDGTPVRELHGGDVLPSGATVASIGDNFVVASRGKGAKKISKKIFFNQPEPI